jgi:hypothetical protein
MKEIKPNLLSKKVATAEHNKTETSKAIKTPKVEISDFTNPFLNPIMQKSPTMTIITISTIALVVETSKFIKTPTKRIY